MSKTLKVSTQVTYTLGALGGWILWYVIGFFLINFYIPPVHENLPFFINQKAIFYIFNIMAILMFASRLWDAVTDPVIGHLSDQSKNPKGRRKPFMKYGLLAPLFCVLIFVPLTQSVSYINVLWLFVALILFYLSYTIYIIPYFALMVDLCKTTNDRINLSTWLGFAESLGIMIASQAPVIWAIFEQKGTATLLARQQSFGIICLIAFFLMLVPMLFIKEPTRDENAPPPIPIKASLKKLLANPLFRAYGIMLILYITSSNIVIIGVPYFITVLLKLEAKYISLMPIMIITSVLFYPIVNILCKKLGNKKVMIMSLLGMAALFLYALFLGTYPFSPIIQLVLLFIFAGIPVSFVVVLLVAVCSDIATHAKEKLGENLEGMYFAGRNFCIKLGFMFGATLFASFTLLGKDIGNDFGIRAIVFVGILFSLSAAYIFYKKYDQSLIGQ
ncbi:MFS transporter [Candidatus Margulisiibacteriota bacterium]